MQFENQIAKYYEEKMIKIGENEDRLKIELVLRKKIKRYMIKRALEYMQLRKSKNKKNSKGISIGQFLTVLY
jgi:hypothetical protein